MKKYLVLLALLSMTVFAQEAPKACCADKCPAEKANCAQKDSTALCPKKGRACQRGSGGKGAGKMQEGRPIRMAVGHRQDGYTMHALGQQPDHTMRIARSQVGTSMDTFISGDSTKVIIKVMRRIDGEMGPMDFEGLDLPNGIHTENAQVFVFKGEEDMPKAWRGTTAMLGDEPPIGWPTDKGTLGVILEKRDDITGAMVVEVIPTSTAAALGLKVGDVIMAVDDLPVTNEVGMMDRMASKKTADPIVITYRRDGKKNKVQGYLIPSAPPMGRALPFPGGMHTPQRMRMMRDHKDSDENVFFYMNLQEGGHTPSGSGEDVQMTETIDENGEKRVEIRLTRKEDK
ncbi:MAG: hypothetical protein ABR98_01075 [Cryomorphaceae bacterium BACL7 MAG-120910-bin2]|nr:MAG: hypothetical protein ABR98_01075 [Cryomorphaceae bacterium BACL7 MAG-120910-bin2]